MSPTLQRLVQDKIQEAGVEAASEFFNVSQLLIKQWRDGSKFPSFAAADKAFREAATSLDPKETMLPTPEVVDTGLEVGWEGRSLALLLPWYRTPNPLTVVSILGLWNKDTMRCFMAHGDAFISHTRNKLANLFLESNCEWGLMVDDDMIVPWGNAGWFREATGFRIPDPFASYSAIRRLLSHKKTLVGGLYFGKNEKDCRPMFNEGCASTAESQQCHTTLRNTCQPAMWVATGCLLIHRSVFEDIDKKYPHLKGSYFSPSEHDLVNSVEEALGFLRGADRDSVMRAVEALTRGMAQTRAYAKIGTGEDVAFCLRAAAAGHQPHIDLGLVLGHVGSQVFGPSALRQ